MKMKSKKGGKEGAKSSEAGIVLKIYVQNFMCHRKLSVPLCRRVLVLVLVVLYIAACLGDKYWYSVDGGVLVYK